MSTTAAMQADTAEFLEGTHSALPEIAPHMAHILELTQKSQGSLTPREINEQLASILNNYDALTALFGENSVRIATELEKIKHEGGAVSGQLLQLQRSLQHHDGALQGLQESTRERFMEVNTRLDVDAARLDARLQEVDQLLQLQDRIVAEQAARLDQFDVAYALLDTATRGNRSRIESVREETQKQHAVTQAQVKGLAAVQREHYQEFTAVRELVIALREQAQALDGRVATVEAGLHGHVDTTRRTFQKTHRAIAAVVAVLLLGFAAFHWAPAFTPVSVQQALAQSANDVQRLQAQIPDLQAQTTTQDGKIQQLTRNMASLKASVGSLSQSVDRLNASATVGSGAEPMASSPSLPDSQWLASQNPKDYTVQLIGVASEEEMQTFLAQNAALLAQRTVFSTVTQPQGQIRYNLFLGVFQSRSAARAAVASLPAPLRNNQPWVRTFNSVQSAVR